MELSHRYIIAVIIAMSVATLITRALPFYIFSDKADHPIIMYLGKYLPPIMMTLLVLYCLRGISLSAYPYGMPELISISVVAGMHLLFRHALLSIGLGTGLYMFFVQTQFFG